MRTRVSLAVILVAAGFVSSTSDARSRGSHRYAISLDGGSPSFVRSVTLTGERIRLELPSAIPRGLGAWIEESTTTTPGPRSGKLIACESDQRCSAALEFFDAWITEVRLGALDASDKDAGYLIVEMLPGSSRYVRTNEQATGSLPMEKRDQWTSNGFRLELSELPCARVLTIDSIGWKWRFRQVRNGAAKSTVRMPEKIEVDDLRVSVAAADLDAWQAWYDQQLATQNPTLSGQIDLLAANKADRVASLKLDDVVPTDLRTLEPDSSEKKPLHFVARFRVGSVALRFTDPDD